MPGDLLEKLAGAEVPPLPDDFRRGVGRRLNPRLLAAHLAELALFALPHAVWHFARAFAGLVYHTVAGRYPAVPPVKED